MSLQSKANVGVVDSINTTGVRLVDIDSHGFSDGDSIYCKSNDCIYVIQIGKSYVVDNIKYVTAANLSSGQWVQALNTDTGGGGGLSTVHTSGAVSGDGSSGTPVT